MNPTQPNVGFLTSGFARWGSGKDHRKPAWSSLRALTGQAQPIDAPLPLPVLSSKQDLCLHPTPHPLTRVFPRKLTKSS